MFNKAKALRQLLDTHSAENLADVLFGIGRELSNKGEFSMATKWLGRSYEVLNTHGLDRLSRDAAELRLSICQSLVHSLICDDSPEQFRKAEYLIGFLESELGDKPLVPLLRPELLHKSPPEEFDVEGYAGIIRRMIRAFALSDAYFKLIIQHIRALYDRSPRPGCAVLDELLDSRIFSSEKEDWIERCFILRIWMTSTTTHIERDNTFGYLRSIFNKIHDNPNRPLGRDATIAAQTVRSPRRPPNKVDVHTMN
jgi:uncharacterized protein YutE (UPF0331/DUF86 family)